MSQEKKPSGIDAYAAYVAFSLAFRKYGDCYESIEKEMNDCGFHIEREDYDKWMAEQKERAKRTWWYSNDFICTSTLYELHKKGILV